MRNRCVFYIGQNPNLYTGLFALTARSVAVQVCTAPEMEALLRGGSQTLGTRPVLVIDAVDRVFYFTYKDVLDLIAKAVKRGVTVRVVVTENTKELYESAMCVTARKIMFNPSSLLA